MSPRDWLASRWERVVAVVTALLVLASCFLLAWSVATGQDTNRVVKGQESQQSRSECVGAYAAADRVAAANLDIRKAEVIDLFARSVIVGDTEALAAEFAVTQEELSTAIAERAEIAGVQGEANPDCAPNDEGQVTGTPPTVVPLEPLEEP